MLHIEFDGLCGTDSTGLYQNSYGGGKRKGLATQLQSTDARKFFPCFDEPALKATFEMTVTVPSFYTVLFNTPLKDSSRVGESLTRHSFLPTPRMSSYLLALIVTEADSV
jgi:aminopeptidase N